MKSTFTLLTSLYASLSLAAGFDLPDKVYGVNLGSWMVIEPWMMPQEWLEMGGEDCARCQDCIRSEFDFVKAYPDDADDKFAEHWDSWFNKGDVERLVDAGINTVRIPLGYWIVEPLVYDSEYYPKGGLKYLKKGLRHLKEAGIAVILDHHALPGVQTANQMFAGRCTDDVQFYTDENYQRALVWTAVMTFFSHTDPDFGSVVAIQAVNEPINNGDNTPGYGEFLQQFVKVIRAVEGILGVGRHADESEGEDQWRPELPADSDDDDDDDDILGGLLGGLNLRARSIDDVIDGSLKDAFDLLNQGFNGRMDDAIRHAHHSHRTPLLTTFMDVLWQNNNPTSPADAENGPALYDDHLYYSFGGVADANEDAYLDSMCSLHRIEDDEKKGNSPVVFGEWSLATQFKASDEFLSKWADAQKLQYSKGAGWIFWNFKIEKSELAGERLRNQWSYFDALDKGYFTKDPSAYNDPNVCSDRK